MRIMYLAGGGGRTGQVEHVSQNEPANVSPNEGFYEWLNLFNQSLIKLIFSLLMFVDFT